ncbi:hypothetical protein E2C01_078552 [Portunus trituberculatus]|uniref:Uncharacterized protein n=1 Tax=Portunus trituberculatus TaxID=210409 RepID=A0A5B7IN13_PORTR|nr:hypothetical protein [Portunus trituberculatus]
MAGNPENHSLIVRPPGLFGYAPRQWFAVCGKTTADKPSVNCNTAECPNACHTHCLRESTSFDCSEVGNLRVAQGVNAHVVYLRKEQHQPPQHDLTDQHDEDSDLVHLDKPELIKLNKALCKELRSKKAILNLFEPYTHHITENREYLVSVIHFLDTIVELRSSLEELDANSIACTARSERIDKEWQQYVTSNETARSWWTSGKPRVLQTPRVSTQINPLHLGSTSCPSGQTSQVQSQVNIAPPAAATNPASSPPGQTSHVPSQVNPTLLEVATSPAATTSATTTTTISTSTTTTVEPISTDVTTTSTVPSTSTDRLITSTANASTTQTAPLQPPVPDSPQTGITAAPPPNQPNQVLNNHHVARRQQQTHRERTSQTNAASPPRTQPPSRRSAPAARHPPTHPTGPRVRPGQRADPPPSAISAPATKAAWRQGQITVSRVS